MSTKSGVTPKFGPKNPIRCYVGRGSLVQNYKAHIHPLQPCNNLSLFNLVNYVFLFSSSIHQQLNSTAFETDAGLWSMSGFRSSRQVAALIYFCIEKWLLKWYKRLNRYTARDKPIPLELLDHSMGTKHSSTAPQQCLFCMKDHGEHGQPKEFQMQPKLVLTASKNLWGPETSDSPKQLYHHQKPEKADISH